MFFFCFSVDEEVFVCVFGVRESCAGVFSSFFFLQLNRCQIPEILTLVFKSPRDTMYRHVTDGQSMSGLQADA